MHDSLTKHFGLTIAFVVPGFIALWALSYVDPLVAGWLGTATTAQTTVGGFLFALLASIGLGVFLSGVRYYVFDRFLNRWVFRSTGAPPDVDHAKRAEAEAAYEDAREQHYRYYQFYANTAVALVLAAVGALVAGHVPSWRAAVVPAILFLGVETVLIASAEDALRKYHEKKLAILGPRVPTLVREAK